MSVGHLKSFLVPCGSEAHIVYGTPEGLVALDSYLEERFQDGVKVGEAQVDGLLEVIYEQRKIVDCALDQ
jgi:hypothetical protein